MQLSTWLDMNTNFRRNIHTNTWKYSLNNNISQNENKFIIIIEGANIAILFRTISYLDKRFSDNN